MPNLTFTALTMKKLTFRTPALWTRRASLLALSGSVALFLSACERNLTPDGPNLGDLYGNFEIREGLAVSATTVDFSAGQTVHFTAKTSISADWVLEVRGTTSGSRWRLEGKSKELNAANATWEGQTTQFPTFAAENCAVKLWYVGQPDTLRSTVQVTGTRALEGVVLDAFDAPAIQTHWTPFLQTGANMKFTTVNEAPRAQGSSYYRMGGAVAWDWLIGMLDLFADDFNTTDGFGLPTDATKVYFNGIFKQKAGLSNGIVLLQFREDDNGDGVYQSSNEDLWAVELRPGANWKLESLKYSDLVTLINGAPASSVGNGIHEPHKLHQVSVLFLANPSSGYAECDADALLFSLNSPAKL
jgi:hypothetical protein